MHQVSSPRANKKIENIKARKIVQNLKRETSIGACIDTPFGAAAARAASFAALCSCRSCLASALADGSECVELRRDSPGSLCPCEWSAECSVGVGDGMLDAAMRGSEGVRTVIE